MSQDNGRGLRSLQLPFGPPVSRGCQRISTEGLNCLLLIEIKFIFKEIMNILNFQKDSLAITKESYETDKLEKSLFYVSKPV